MNRYLVDEDGNAHPLPVGSTVLGRSEDADLRLTDIFVARRHARIDVDGDGGRVVITDLDSPGGTWINDRHVRSAELNVGDVVRIGRTAVTLRAER
jgi:pSer/pThr/pTyr-binding forkhead associated (FHA) protein